MAKKTKLDRIIEGIELTPEDKPTITWFPGHMAKALRKVQEKLKMIDIVLEIRDARVPLISGNDKLQQTVGQKKRLIIVNKINLADPQTNKLWKQWFEKQGLKRIIVVTQGRNCQAQRFYQKNGFMTDSLEYWFHKWF